MCYSLFAALFSKISSATPLSNILDPRLDRLSERSRHCAGQYHLELQPNGEKFFKVPRRLTWRDQFFVSINVPVLI